MSIFWLERPTHATAQLNSTKDVHSLKVTSTYSFFIHIYIPVTEMIARTLYIGCKFSELLLENSHTRLLSNATLNAWEEGQYNWVAIFDRKMGCLRASSSSTSMLRTPSLDNVGDL